MIEIAYYQAISMNTLVAISYSESYVAVDGNGNILTLVNSSDGSTVASYEYSPFGECIKATGPMALENKFRFSTKYTDDETGLIYYGYRYYDAKNGRWVSRDPLGENGGENLYGFCFDSPLNYFDYLGLKKGCCSGGASINCNDVSSQFEILWRQLARVGGKITRDCGGTKVLENGLPKEILDKLLQLRSDLSFGVNSINAAYQGSSGPISVALGLGGGISGTRNGNYLSSTVGNSLLGIGVGLNAIEWAIASNSNERSRAGRNSMSLAAGYLGGNLHPIVGAALSILSLELSQYEYYVNIESASTLAAGSASRCTSLYRTFSETLKESKILNEKLRTCDCK